MHPSYTNKISTYLNYLSFALSMCFIKVALVKTSHALMRQLHVLLLFFVFSGPLL